MMSHFTWKTKTKSPCWCLTALSHRETQCCVNHIGSHILSFTQSQRSLHIIRTLLSLRLTSSKAFDTVCHATLLREYRQKFTSHGPCSRQVDPQKCTTSTYTETVYHQEVLGGLAPLSTTTKDGCTLGETRLVSLRTPVPLPLGINSVANAIVVDPQLKQKASVISARYTLCARRRSAFNHSRSQAAVALESRDKADISMNGRLTASTGVPTRLIAGV